MIPVGPGAVRPLPRRKGPMGRWERMLPDGRWVPEADAIAGGIPLATPVPTTPPAPVVVRHEAPEVPSVPAAPASTPAPIAKPARQPTDGQREAWRLCHDEGMYWPDAAERLGTTAWTVANQVRGYMRAMGITGAEPGRMDREEAKRRSAAGRGQAAPPSPLASEPPRSKSKPGSLVVPGAEYAPDIPETIPDAEPGHEMTASTGGEPGDGERAVEGTPAPHRPTTTQAVLEDLPSSDQEPAPVDAAASIARLARERDEMEMARDELREMLDDAIERADQRPGRDRYLDALLSGLSTHPTDNIRDRIERVLGVEADRDSWADGYRHALGDVLDIIRGTRGTTYPQADIIERVARLAIDVPAA